MGNGDSSMNVFQEGELEEEFRRNGGEGDVSVTELFQSGYNELINFLVQPPRKRYDVDQLGQTEFVLSIESSSISIKREDFVVNTSSSINASSSPRASFTKPSRVLQASIWLPVEKRTKTLPCVIYLHCNTGSRLNVLPIRDKVLASGAAIVAMDFAGCGLSSSDFLTGGLRESRDIKHLIAHLNFHYNDVLALDNIFIWGHSLGAAAALLYATESSANNVVSGMVLDSPYTSLSQIAEDMVLQVKRNGIPAPAFVLRAASNRVCASVESRAGFRVASVDMVKALSCSSSIPSTLLLTGTKDLYVPTRHSDTIVNSYGSDSTIQKLTFLGDHYGTRPDSVIDEAVLFMKSRI